MANSIEEKDLSEYVELVGENHIRFEVEKKRFHDWFKQKCIEINAKLKKYNSEIYDKSGLKGDDEHHTPDISINRAEKTIDEVKGRVFTYIDFNPSKPDFLFEEDKERWYDKIFEVVKERFSILNSVYNTSDLYYFSFYTSAELKNRFYTSSDIKEEIEKNLNEAIEYIKWYSSSVKEYNSIANETKTSHEKRLEDHISNLN